VAEGMKTASPGMFFRDDAQTFHFTRCRLAWRLTVASEALTNADLKVKTRVTSLSSGVSETPPL